MHYSICTAKTKTLISCDVTAQLICVFVFVYMSHSTKVEEFLSLKQILLFNLCFSSILSLVVYFHYRDHLPKIYDHDGDTYAVVDIYILNKGVTPLIFACPTTI